MARIVEKAIPVGSSGVAKTGLALGATALGLNLLGGGSLLRNLTGSPVQTVGQPGTVVTVDASGQPFVHGGHSHGGGYVSEKEMCLIRESSEKDAIIAKYQANEYANALVKSEVEPLKDRVCSLEKDSAVTEAELKAYKRYAESAFIKQPRASINDSIVTCEPCGCCRCGKDRD